MILNCQISQQVRVSGASSLRCNSTLLCNLILIYGFNYIYPVQAFIFSFQLEFLLLQSFSLFLGLLRNGLHSEWCTTHFRNAFSCIFFLPSKTVSFLINREMLLFNSNKQKNVIKAKR